MRILCVSAPLPGHLDWGGYLATAAELQRRGHTLLWASGKAVVAPIQQAGVPFHLLAETGWRWPPPAPLPPPTPENQEQWQRVRTLRALDQWLEVDRVQAAVEALYDLARQWRAEVILSEMFVAAAGIVAEMANIPLIVAGWPAQAVKLRRPDSLIDEARQRLDHLLKYNQVDGINWSPVGPPTLLSPDLHLSYWSPSWFEVESMLEQTRHVGGVATAALPPDPSFPSVDDRPWVLITLGTSFGNDPNFFVAAAHATDRLGCIPIVVLGGQIVGESVKALLSKLPVSTQVRQQVDFQAVLPYTAAAIHHGGAGTTHALVTRAVPQILVPHAADQQRQAQGVVRSGVGLAFAAKEVTIELLEDALAAILPDLSSYRSAALQLRDEFAQLGGVEAAAQWVEKRIL
ncbi:MAG: glycosyltransferase [Caldilineaceae bacterium]